MVNRVTRRFVPIIHFAENTAAGWSAGLIGKVVAPNAPEPRSNVRYVVLDKRR